MVTRDTVDCRVTLGSAVFRDTQDFLLLVLEPVVTAVSAGYPATPDIQDRVATLGSADYQVIQGTLERTQGHRGIRVFAVLVVTRGSAV